MLLSAGVRAALDGACVCVAALAQLTVRPCNTRLKVAAADEQVDLDVLLGLEALHGSIYLVQLAVAAAFNGNLDKQCTAQVQAARSTHSTARTCLHGVRLGAARRAAGVCGDGRRATARCVGCKAHAAACFSRFISRCSSTTTRVLQLAPR